MKAQEALTAMNQLPQGDDFKCLSVSGLKFEETIKDSKQIVFFAIFLFMKISCRNSCDLMNYLKN